MKHISYNVDWGWWSENKNVFFIDDEFIGQYTFQFNDVIILTAVYVDPDYRGEGYGTKIMNKAIEYITEHKLVNVYLEVDKTNTVATALYLKLGFEFSGDYKPEEYLNLMKYK